jgi:hypothetical protein
LTAADVPAGKILRAFIDSRLTGSGTTSIRHELGDSRRTEVVDVRDVVSGRLAAGEVQLAAEEHESKQEDDGRAHHDPPFSVA